MERCMKKIKKPKKQLNRDILDFLGAEKNCITEQDNYTVQDLDDYDEWIDWLRSEIKDARYENNKIELQTLNRQLQQAKENKRKIVKWLFTREQMGGATMAKEICYS